MKYYYEMYRRCIRPMWIAQQLRITEVHLEKILSGKYRDRNTKKQLEQINLILGGN